MATNVYADSPTYQALSERYGRTMGYDQANAFARQHGTTVETLVAECGLVLTTRQPKGTTVKVTDLLMALGY